VIVVIGTNINPITLILVLVFSYPILKGFLFKFSSHNLKYELDEVSRSISFIFSLILGIYYGKKIFIQHDGGLYKQIYDTIPQGILQYIERNNFFTYVVLIPLLVLVFYKIIKLIFNLVSYLTFYPILDSIEKFLSSKNDFFRRMMGMFFQLPKSLCYILLVAFILNIMSMFNITGMGKLNKYLETSKPYNAICKAVIIPVTNSAVAKQLPNIIDNSFRVVMKDAQPEKPGQGKSEVNANTKTIVYYNGVTLDQGIESDLAINKLAKQLTASESTTRAKARVLYDWIGKNVSYDNNKANKVLNNDFNVQSGAIPTFNTRKGICFDYSCLYVAMSRASNIKVRLVTGEGFNGISWVSHAWNQVYLPEEGKWINVDTTFYKGGNYFDSKRFNLDHRNAQIVGEW
jgi:hypothetical protein